MLTSLAEDLQVLARALDGVTHASVLSKVGSLRRKIEQLAAARVDIPEGYSRGPWELTELPDHEGGPPVYRITADTTLFLHVSPCADGYCPGENEANAKLIAKLPDLVEELVLLRAEHAKLKVQYGCSLRDLANPGGGCMG